MRLGAVPPAPAAKFGSEASATLGARTVKLTQTTDYPWKGDVSLAVAPDQPANFSVHVRIPGWARNAVVPSSSR